SAAGSSKSYIIGGIGTNSPLSPYSGNTATIDQNPSFPDTPPFCDQAFNGSCPLPADLVYAGNASQEGSATNDGTGNYGQTNSADLIGIFGPGGQNGTTYELALFTATETGAYASDSAYANLSGPSYDSPDGTADWQDYTLATAQLPDTANPNGDPSNTVLFALDNQPGNPGSGHLYVSINQDAGGCNPSSPNAPQPPSPPCPGLIGTHGTWTQVTGTPTTWTAAPPQLASADVN